MNSTDVVKKRAPRARFSRTNGTNSLADAKRCVHARQQRENETDEKTISSTTHTATKRRPAITKGPAERGSDAPTRQEDDDVGPSARAAAGKRASTASTKVRNTALLVRLFFLHARRRRRSIDRTIDPTKRNKTLRGRPSVSIVKSVVRRSFCFFSSSIDVIVIDRSSTSPMIPSR